jgi:hypothetical protein
MWSDQTRKVRLPSSRMRVAALLLTASLATVPLVACRSDTRGTDRSRKVDPRGAAASRMVFWRNCYEVVGFSDAELDLLRDRGVGGFVCQTQHLRNLGGSEDFTADPNASLTGANHNLQRAIRDSKFVERAAARGMKLWLGVYFSNYYNHATPLAEWFDDTAWSTQVVPSLANLAGAARTLGFAGVAFDEEPYYGGTWKWDYPGNTHTEAEVRAKVRERGAQMMQAIVGAYPRVEILDYWTYFPEGWQEYVQLQINGIQNHNAPKVQINLWDGLTSVPGYGPIVFLEAAFFKTWHVSGANWDTALSYHANRTMAYLSRNLSNWAYASGRIGVSPFAWIDSGRTAFEAARDPGYVATQLAAFRKWGMKGVFANYGQQPLNKFDYAPYAPGMRAATTPGEVDTQPPGLSITSIQKTEHGVHVTGSATDNLGMRSVRWQTGSASGAAPMTWVVTSGDYRTGYRWRMDWTADIPAAPGQQIAFTAQDIKGLDTKITKSATRLRP